MGYGQAEDPALSATPHLVGVDYPISREQLAELVADNGAPADLINLFKSLPRERYESTEQVMRDFAEAGRRFGIGNHPEDEDAARDRRNIGREAVEEAPAGHTRHP